MPTPGDGQQPGRRRRGRRALVISVVAIVLIALLAWPIGLVMWADGKIQHTDALSGAKGTDGTTYLLTGSDSRADGGVKDDGTKGARTDTILLLHVPDHGPTALISLPRDTYVEIPGHDANKINAAFAWGGAPLLVKTVEGMSGLTIDHYAEIGMAGVKDVVDSVGGVRLCYDKSVKDPDSRLKWKKGCHEVHGKTALAFARMRKADAEGDIGRAERQRQLVSAIMGKVEPKSLVLHPSRQVALIDAATGALTVDESMGMIDMGKMALAFKAANGKGGITGTPPLSSIDYRPGGVGSTVQIDPDKAAAFWVAIRDGELEPGKVGGMPNA
ncbi:LCP family protein [Cellulomonas edaphi]|uniref:LCP family protein n=1 Tax=Cellulomonas edaphi TaxID=3053468 RepID=A0ABT7S829_9CELL|nr:LCP family protein [Cellulomons edaphi]MDM7831773.1 LCP family protein [Cellulomons edaphi]